MGLFKICNIAQKVIRVLLEHTGDYYVDVYIYIVYKVFSCVENYTKNLRDKTEWNIFEKLRPLFLIGHLLDK